MEPSQDPYKVLGLTIDASSESIKKAYKSLARKWHPDKNLKHQDLAEAKFKQISEAYKAIVSQSKSRQRSYNETSRPNHSHREQSVRRERFDEKFFSGETSKEVSATKRKSDLLKTISQTHADMMDKFMAGKAKNNRGNSETFNPDILPELDDDDYEQLVLDRLKVKCGV